MRFVYALFALASIGCAKGTFINDTPDGGGTKTMNEPPHAEGNIILGEAHTTKGGTPTPIVGVSFVPDTSTVKSCGAQSMGTCKVTKAAKCTQACGTGEYCTWDDNCNATCKRACTKSCATDEECYFPSEGADPECRTKESFDSGPVAFAGTSVPITLYPPYKYTGPTSGAPFLEGAEITVQGSGAAGAGFTKWDQKVTATTFLQTQLGKLAMTQVFSTAPLPVDWTPGNDKITITLGGAGGSAVCEGNDPTGHFDVPRDVVEAALGAASTLSISVTRQRQDIKKGIATKGMLTTGKVQPEGWVKISTYSSESASFQGCSNGQAFCGGKCTSVTTDSQNCGKCGNVCTTGSCSEGMCSGSGMSCNDCFTNAQSGVCKSAFDACNNNSACTNLTNCIGNCNGNQTCISNCTSTYSSGLTLYNNRRNCLCNTACYNECKTECGN